MKIKESMHNVTKVPSTTTIIEAAKLMDKKEIGSILIEENGKVAGMMTERDILRKVVAAGKKCEETTVKDIMNSPLITIDSNSSLEEASDLMASHHIRRLIVTEKDKIIGIVTARNLAEMLKYSLGKSIKNAGIHHYRPSYGKPE